MTLTRRRLLATTAVTAPVAALALAGCATSGSTTAPSVTNTIASIGQVATIIENFSQGLVNTLPTLQTVSGLPASLATNLQKYITMGQGILTAVKNGATSATALQSDVLQIEAFVNAVTPAIAPLVALIPGPGTAIAAGITGFSVLLPVIEGFLNPLLPATAAPKAGAMMAGAPFRAGLAEAHIGVAGAMSLVAGFAGK
ncbi:MAG: hypothetical protein KGL39_07490 [Patescibacteria group bacterium]|nr:hypothetical protein [Patescibacteria group bacterium]